MSLRRVAAVMAAAVALAGCGGSDACDEVVGDGLALIQDLVQEIDATGDFQVDSGATDFDQRAAALDARADAAGCSPAAINEQLRERATELQATTEAGEAFIDLVRAGALLGE